MRRLLPLVLPVAAALAAGLLWAHDATWSILAGIALGVVAVVAAVAASNGRFAAPLALVGVVVLAVGTAAAASGLWLALVGTGATVTVTHVHDHDGGKGVGPTEDVTVRLADGSEVAGPVRNFRPGSHRVGDRLDVVYDPTGLVRFPVLAGDRHHSDDAVGGPLAMAGALVLLVVLRLRRPLPPPPGGPRLANVRVGDLQRRLARDRDGPGPDCAG